MCKRILKTIAAIIAFLASLIAIFDFLDWNPFQRQPYVDLQKDYGITENTLNNIKEILTKNEIPPAEQDKKIREIAVSYQHLKRILNNSQDDDPNIKTLRKEANQALEKGDFSQAEKKLQAAIEHDKKTAKKRLFSAASSHAQLALNYQLQIKYLAAIHAYEKALNILPKDDIYDVTRATWLNEQSEVYLKNGEYSNALNGYKNALGLWRSLNNKTSNTSKNWFGLASCWDGIGKSHYHINEYHKALNAYDTALTLTETHSPYDYQTISKTTNNLALTYKKIGDYQKSKILYEKSIEILEKNLGANYIDLASPLNNLAGLYSSKKLYEKSESLYKRVLRIREGYYKDKKHPSIATALNNIAHLHLIQKHKYAEAKELLERALKIRLSSLGEKHPTVATVFKNLGRHSQLVGQYKEAKKLYLKALQIRKDALGDGHIKTAEIAYLLGLLYKTQKNHLEAKKYLTQALEIAQKKPKDNHMYIEKIKQELNTIPTTTKL